MSYRTFLSPIPSVNIFYNHIHATFTSSVSLSQQLFFPHSPLHFEHTKTVKVFKFSNSPAAGLSFFILLLPAYKYNVLSWLRLLLTLIYLLSNTLTLSATWHSITPTTSMSNIPSQVTASALRAKYKYQTSDDIMKDIGPVIHGKVTVESDTDKV